MVEDDHAIVYGTDQEQEAEKSNVMTLFPHFPPGAEPVRDGWNGAEIGVIGLEGPPGQGKEHEEKYFGCTAGYSSEAQARSNERDCRAEGGERLGVSFLCPMPQPRAEE